jgi:hypothetical protein
MKSFLKCFTLTQVIGTISATDKDDHLPAFSFTLVKPNGNFSVVDNNGERADHFNA